ncbi:oligosaccharide flippase family protein [Streptomyces kaniharaensis]|uniref:Oligosaccharide flippase family protein n=1 Tax=Streptomyces kaniharaensis TaxID=212423 RepID=A0A6N7KUD0_9ACTN|nr:oligosaccharide flippase family protein [Streptomyces kaniharaensis]MQS15206.1 oligosaccharide flippase family protein [Streptomyces kaniharaensis]
MSLLKYARPKSRPTAPRPCSCPLALPCECSYTTLLKARLRSASRWSSGEPLLRNGHLLAASSVIAAGLGSVFWILATRYYSAETVGRSYAALSAAMFLSTLGSLNLGDALVRFVPAAGQHTRRLVLRCYAISVGCSALVAGAFLLLIPLVAHDLEFLRGPVLAVSFIAATAGYSVFVLQDGALTGTRRIGWVVGENTVFAVAKAGLLAGCAALAMSTGILVSWAAAMVISIVLANVVLFRRAVPGHQAETPARERPPDKVMRWATADYVGNLFSFATYTVVPLLVLDEVGARVNAYYSLAFVIASTLYVAVFSMGHSLVVEGARDPRRLAEHARRMLRHSALLMVAAALLVVALAPWILGLFGPEYAAHGTTVMRLMALSAIPNVVPNVVIQMARVRRSMPWMIGVRLVFSVVIIALVALLLPRYGLAGVGWAWLIAECAVALPLLFVLRRWLRSLERSDSHDR